MGFEIHGSQIQKLNWADPINKDSVGAWFLNEQMGGLAWDISGKRNHGTLTNGPLWAGGGLQFDGTDDYIAGPSNVVTAFPVTIFIRVMLRSIPTTNMIIQTCDSPTATDYYQGAQLTFSSSAFSLQTGDGAGGGAANRKTLAGTTAPAVNKWYNLVAVFISHGNYVLYVNGVNDGGTYSGTAATSVFTSDPLSIGRWDSDLDRFSNMVVSNCRIWSRALNAAEIRRLNDNPNAGLYKSDTARYYLAAVGGTSGVSIVNSGGPGATFGIVRAA